MCLRSLLVGRNTCERREALESCRGPAEGGFGADVSVANRFRHVTHSSKLASRRSTASVLAGQPSEAMLRSRLTGHACREAR